MKLLILGLSGSGKSTIAKLLAEKYDLELVEADDAVMNANGGTWPSDYDTRDEFVDKIFEETNKKVLSMKKVLYVTSWLTSERIDDFIKNQFKIIEMHADFDELLKRKENRDGKSSKREERFKNTYISYFENILSQEYKQYYLISLDTTNLNANQIIEKVSSSIES